MRINRCVKCSSDFEAFYKSNVCVNCESEKEFGFPLMVETESLHTMANVSKTRLKEMDKWVTLPEKRPDGKHHYVGTRVRGKIKDHRVDLRP